MPGSHHGRLRGVIWPPTQDLPQQPETFESTGECVIERILMPLREKLPFKTTRSPNQNTTPKVLGALSPGALFKGHQAAVDDAKHYSVEVEVKDVDLTDFYLCGYLTIHNLTTEYPNLTTFFEAEVIGPSHHFLTSKWDADYAADQRHWEQFPYFKERCHQFLDSSNSFIYDFLSNDVIFMRWKEHFLVPDHRISNITGASYAGFYYIAYDRRNSSIDGYYYHRESKDFQRLLLNHVPSKLSPSFEFR